MNCAVGSTPHGTKNFVSINLPSLSSVSSSPSIVDHSHEHKICCYFSHLDKIFKKLKLSDFPFSYYPISLLFFQQNSWKNSTGYSSFSAMPVVMNVMEICTMQADPGHHSKINVCSHPNWKEIPSDNSSLITNPSKLPPNATTPKNHTQI